MLPDFFLLPAQYRKRKREGGPGFAVDEFCAAKLPSRFTKKIECLLQIGPIAARAVRCRQPVAAVQDGRIDSYLGITQERQLLRARRLARRGKLRAGII